MEFVKKNLGKWVEAAIILVVGILVIVAGATLGNGSYDVATGTYTDVAADTLTAISYVLGIAFIVVGALGLVMAGIAAIVSKKGFAAAGMAGGIVLAAGIWFVAKTQAANLIGLLIGYVPFVMIVVGAVILVDAVLLLVNGLRDKNIKGVLVAVIIEAIVAVVSIVLGVLCIAENGEGDTIITQGAQLIIFGIIVVVYGALVALSTFIALPKSVTVIAVEKKEEPKAEEKPEETK